MSRRSQNARPPPPPVPTLADCPTGSKVLLPRQDGTKKWWSWLTVASNAPNDNAVVCAVPGEPNAKASLRFVYDKRPPLCAGCDIGQTCLLPHVLKCGVLVQPAEKVPPAHGESRKRPVATEPAKERPKQPAKKAPSSKAPKHSVVQDSSDDDTPPAKKSRAKAKKKPRQEESDDDWEEEEVEEDNDDDEDGDEEEEADDDGSESEELPKKKAARPAKTQPSKQAPSGSKGPKARSRYKEVDTDASEEEEGDEEHEESAPAPAKAPAAVCAGGASASSWHAKMRTNLAGMASSSEQGSSKEWSAPAEVRKLRLEVERLESKLQKLERERQAAEAKGWTWILPQRDAGIREAKEALRLAKEAVCFAEEDHSHGPQAAAVHKWTREVGKWEQKLAECKQRQSARSRGPDGMDNGWTENDKAEVERAEHELARAREQLARAMREAEAEDEEEEEGEEEEGEEEDEEDEDGQPCEQCNYSTSVEGCELLLCDGPGCERAYHQLCLQPKLLQLPPEEEKWFCPHCTTPTAPDARPNSTAQSSKAAGKKVAVQPQPSEADLDDDEPIVTGSTGANALADFPHAREHCVVERLETGPPEKHCPQCYCYVCDAPASGCPQWEHDHCRARHADPQWQQKRKTWQEAVTLQQAGGGGGGVGSASSGEPTWTCEKLLSAVQTVHPEEAPQPEALSKDVSLRPYQKQSLAFCLAAERRGVNRGSGWIADEIGMGKTMVCTSLILANPCTKRRASDKDYNEMNSADYKMTMVVCPPTLVQQWEDELARHAPGLTVGVHYTPKVEQQYEEFKYILFKRSRDEPTGLELREDISKGRKIVKVNRQPTGAARVAGIARGEVLLEVDGEWINTLQQAETLLSDVLGAVHLRMRAAKPALNPNSARVTNRSALAGDVRDIDVLVTTPSFMITSQWDKRQFDTMRLHRLIVDESHLLGSRGDFGVNKVVEVAARATHVWLVTGTPFSSSLNELSTQVDVLRQHAGWVSPPPGIRGLMDVRSLNPTKLSRPEGQKAVDVLRRHMTRHTKSQRIGGDVALALPESDLRIEWLELTQTERLEVQAAACKDGMPTCMRALEQKKKKKKKKAQPPIQDMQWRKLESELQGQRRALAHCEGGFRSSTKYRWLLQQLTKLAEAEPGTRIVVFSHFNGLVTALAPWLHEQPPRGGWTIHAMGRATPPVERHAMISTFQEAPDEERSGGPSQVLLTTYDVAAVGITLTRASRIFLLEPTLDPRVAVQAVGRIHRMGQTKEVHIVQVAYRDSLDVAILALHQRVRSGELVLQAAQLPEPAVALFRANGVGAPHDYKTMRGTRHNGTSYTFRKCRRCDHESDDADSSDDEDGEGSDSGGSGGAPGNAKKRAMQSNGTGASSSGNAKLKGAKEAKPLPRDVKPGTM